MVLAGGLLTAVAAPPAVAVQAVAKNGAAPVERPLPLSQQPNRGLPKGVKPPVEPPRAKADGKPLSAKAAAARDADEGIVAQAATARALGPAADVVAQAAAQAVLLRPGYLLGDTSLAAYFSADVVEGDPTSWDNWFATVTDTTSGQQQRSVVLRRIDLQLCRLLERDYCRSFGSADGWVLVPGRKYTVTITVERVGGLLEESVPSNEATARTTALPPAVPAAQAAGCSCPNVLSRAPGVQALRGNMVNTATGAMVRTEQDLSMPSFGIPFQAVRVYSSSNTTTGMFGPGWSWTYDPRIVSQANGDVRLQAEDGSQVVYNGNGAGGYTRPAGVQSVLTKTATGWTLRTGDQRTLTFAANGSLTKIANQRGDGVTLAYSGGSLRSLTDASGRVISVLTTNTGRITKLILPDLRSVGFEYDANGRLVTVRDPRLNLWRYSYDAGGQLAQVRDPLLKNVLTNVYGTDGRVSTQTDAVGAVTRFGWNAATQVATTTDPDGVITLDTYRENVLLSTQNGNNDATVHRYDGELNRGLTVDALGNQDEVTYDAAGNVVATVSADPFGFTESNEYDSRNNLLRHVDRRSKTWEYTYNDQNDMISQREPNKPQYQYQYDARGLLIERTDPLGNKTSYEYDASGNRTAEVMPTGRRTELGYDSTGRMTSITDPRGTADGTSALTRAKYTTRMDYDAEDRQIRAYQPGNLLPAERLYGPSGDLLTSSDPLKRTSRYEYDAAGRMTADFDPKGLVTRYTYTAAGRRLSVTDAQGNRTSWTYDERGQVKTETTPRGNRIKDNDGTAAQVAPYVTTFYYDIAGNQTRSERPDPSGAMSMVDTSFDALGRATGQNDQSNRSTAMGYDASGNITSMTDEDGTALGYKYDDSGRRISGGVDGDLDTQARVDYDDMGNPLTQVTATGGIVTWEYDADNRPISIVEPRGNVPGATKADFRTTYTYDPAGNLVAERDPLGNTTRYEYDGQDRVIATTAPDGSVTRTAYDDASQAIAVAGPVKGALADTFASSFIAATQLVAGRGPVANTVKNLPTITSPVSFAFGLVPGVPVTRYAYDANGLPVASGDQLGRVRRTVYDTLDRPLFTGDPLGRVRSFGYDADSNLTTLETASNVPGVALTSTDRARRTMTNTYDNLGRLTRTAQGTSGPTYTYGYDANDRLTSSADPGGTSTFSYNRTGLLTRSQRNGRAFTYEYDKNDNITQRTYPDGTTIDARYDAGDRMTGMTTTRGGTAQSFGFTYDPADRLVRTTYPGSPGAVENREYDRAGRLSQISAASGAGVQTGYELNRDAVGNPTLVTRTIQDGAGSPRVTEASAYAYDASQRLTSACYGATVCATGTASAERFDYGYDLVGNRTSQVHTISGDLLRTTATSYVFDAADQLKLETKVGTGAGVTAYGYDGEGNQTSAGDERFVYNLDHTLASATSGGQTSTFGYDAQGNRVTGVAGTGAAAATRTWDWDQNQAMPMLASESGAGAGTRSYAYGPDGSQLGLYTGGGAAGSLYTHDWLGGTAAVLAADGTGQWAYNYDPYGNPRGSALTAGGRQLTAGAPANPLQFAGGYNDNAGSTGGGTGGQAGNYHLRARDYDTSTGRFTGTDPLARGAGSPGASSYTYVDGRPTAAIDPSGLAGETPLNPRQADWQDYREGERAGSGGSGDGATSGAELVDLIGVDPLAAQRTAAQQALAEAEQFTKSLGDEILRLVMDLIGVTDAVNCIKNGDIGACLSTVLGAVPWGKMFKAAKVAIKAVGLGRRLVEGYGRLKAARAAVEAIMSESKALIRAAKEQAEKKQKELLKAAAEAAAKRATQAKAAAAAAKRAAAAAKETAAKAVANVKRSRGLGCPPNSFIAGTRVLMADGSSAAIETLRPGDAVAATVESGAGVPAPRQVSATIVGEGSKHLVDLQLVGAGSGGGGPPADAGRSDAALAKASITATAGHPMFVPGTGWVEAGDLKAGQKLLDDTGRTVTVAKAVHHSKVTTVYNLTVADRHTFYVQAPDGTTVLTHNTNPAVGKACNLKPGNNRAAAQGTKVHNGPEWSAFLGKMGYSGSRELAVGSIPDGFTPGGMPVELKPDTVSGRRAGTRQLRRYMKAGGFDSAELWVYSLGQNGAAFRLAAVPKPNSRFWEWK